MKKLGCMVLGLCMCAGLFAGCGTTTIDSETSVVYVDKSGTVVSVDVEQLDEAYYNAEELESFVNEEVTAYTEEHGSGTVKVESLTVEEGTAKLQMKYETAEDYSNFNGIDLYQGSVIDSLAAGYVYEGAFSKVESGEVVGSATKQDIYAEQELKVVIIRANTDVKIEGEICYMSSENVQLTGADSVSIGAEQSEDEGFETESYTFIIYK